MDGYEKEEIKDRLFRKIQPLLAQYGISVRVLMDAINNSLCEMEIGDEDIGSEILPLIFGRIFGEESLLPMDTKTPSGREIPFDVLMTAYELWRKAKRIALRHGLDSLDAAGAMTHAVRATAGRISNGGAPIHSIRNYMFKCYMNTLKGIAQKAGIIGSTDNKINADRSDGGAFLAAIENAILCNELLASMTPNLKKAVFFRYMLNCSCEETAAEIGLSNNSFRKFISIGLRKTFETCVRESRSSKKAEMPETERRTGRRDHGGKDD